MWAAAAGVDWSVGWAFVCCCQCVSVCWLAGVRAFVCCCQCLSVCWLAGVRAFVCCCQCLSVCVAVSVCRSVGLLVSGSASVAVSVCRSVLMSVSVGLLVCWSQGLRWPWLRCFRQKRPATCQPVLPATMLAPRGVRCRPSFAISALS